MTFLLTLISLLFIAFDWTGIGNTVHAVFPVHRQAAPEPLSWLPFAVGVAVVLISRRPKG